MVFLKDLVVYYLFSTECAGEKIWKSVNIWQIFSLRFVPPCRKRQRELKCSYPCDNCGQY